jgi:preprotein translocase subunit SecG
MGINDPESYIIFTIFQSAFYLALIFSILSKEESTDLNPKASKEGLQNITLLFFGIMLIISMTLYLLSKQDKYQNEDKKKPGEQFYLVFTIINSIIVGISIPFVIYYIKNSDSTSSKA